MVKFSQILTVRKQRLIVTQMTRCYRPYCSCKITDSEDTCSWRRQLERTRSWKVLSWKVQNEIREIEAVSSSRSWKVRVEVGKSEVKWESSIRSWKARAEVEKYNSLGSFQLRSVLNNLARLFPT